MSRINTVIFDIGNVLTSFNWLSYINKMLRGSSRETIERVQSAIWTHGLWDEFDIGLMSDEEIVSGFVSYAPDCEREICLLCDEKNIGGCIMRRDTAVPWITHVKSLSGGEGETHCVEYKNTGRKVLFLSNYSKIIMRSNPKALDFLPFMDGGIFSCDVHLIKPDLRIYELLRDKYNLEPSKCIFIDDIEKNVQAAREVGFNALKLDTYEQARFDLDRILRDN